jgi:lipid-A-disaccharide synthase
MSVPLADNIQLPTSDAKSLFISVGDHSASNHATRVIRKLKQLQPDLELWGMGDAQMEAAGMNIEVDFQQYTAFGIISVLKHLPRLAALKQALADRICSRKPDAVLFIDFGGFHLALAKLLKKRLPDLPVIFLISPQVWGSRPWRAKTIGKVVDKMLVIFPFEESWYKLRGIDAKFVGHPLSLRHHDLDMAGVRSRFCQMYSLECEKPIVAIFPGSRRMEIDGNLPPALQAVRWLVNERPDVQFVISQANEKFGERLTELTLKYRLASCTQVKVARPADNAELMMAADVIWAKSGTTTLEASLMKKPMLIFYRADWLSWMVFLLFKRVKWVGLPNLLTGGVVPELFQLDCRAEQFVKYTRDWLEVPAAREVLVSRLAKIDQQLGSTKFDDVAASEVLEIVNRSKTSLTTETAG